MPEITLENKIIAFSTLGKFLKQFDSVSFMENPELTEINTLFSDKFLAVIKNAEVFNPWFTRDFISYSFASLSEMLKEQKLRNWLQTYPELNSISGKSFRVGIIMAGNIPLVGFHDLLTVCFSGHKAVVKMSSKDDKIFPLILEILTKLNAEFAEIVIISTDSLKNIDAVIATGNDNSSRYFEYYFGKYPHIIRKNRNSVAVLSGDETAGDFKKLADDIFLYFGMGCRSVSKLFLPVGFNIPKMLDNFESYSYLYNHNKYANNYDYYKAIYLLNMLNHLDTGYLLIKEDVAYSSPVGIVFYEYYESIAQLKTRLNADSEKIQCIVSNRNDIENAVKFGQSQQPALNDYADNADTLKFLINLYKK